jgi:hypothetical protein
MKSAESQTTTRLILACAAPCCKAARHPSFPLTNTRLRTIMPTAVQERTGRSSYGSQETAFTIGQIQSD